MTTRNNENHQKLTEKPNKTTEQQPSSNDNNTNAAYQPPRPPHDPNKRPASPINHQDASKKAKKSTDLTKFQEQMDDHTTLLDQPPPGTFNSAFLDRLPLAMITSFIRLLSVQDTINYLLSFKNHRNNLELRTDIKTIHPTLSEKLHC